MKNGFEKITVDFAALTAVFEFNGLYYDRAGIIKATSELWAQSKTTKYRKLNDLEEWNDLETQYKIGCHLAAPIGIHHLLLTNGAVLNKSTLREVCKNGKSTVVYVDNGIQVNAYRASLIIHYFMDDSIPITSDPFYFDGNYNNTDISNINIKDLSKKKEKKERKPAAKSTQKSPQPQQFIQTNIFKEQQAKAKAETEAQNQAHKEYMARLAAERESRKPRNQQYDITNIGKED